MAPVDPAILLNTIVYLLDKNGGLKNDRVVRQFTTLMTLAAKLVNKAIYLQILQRTDSEDILLAFLKHDGHRILLKWLTHFAREQNHAFLLDTLHLLGHLPFNVDRVSQNDLDELQLKVAELASAESGEAKDIRESARHLYDLCLTKGVFKTSPTPDNDERPSIHPPPVASSSSSSPVETTISSKHPLTSQRVNQNERTPIVSFNESQMATTATLTASSVESSNKRKSEENLGPAASRKPTHRRISSSSPSETSTSMKTATIDLDHASTRPAASFRIPKLGRPTSSADGASPPSSDMNDSPPVKVSPSTHRQTSDEFNAQQGKRKFSLSQYKERKRLKSDELQSTHADTDMRLHTAEPLKPTSPIDDSADPPHPAAISPKSEEICKDTVMKSNLSEPGVKKVLKKKVIWADDKNHALVQTSFFEVDDSELSDMHIFARTCATNISIAQLEKVMERDFRKRRGAQHDVNASDTDDKQHATAQPLPPLLRILFPEAIQFPPVVSQERAVQEEREKTVLQALFIRSFLPDSPGEPDGGDLAGGGTASQTEPKLIPLEDNNSSGAPSKVPSVTNNVAPTANVPSTPMTSLSAVPTTAPPAAPNLSSFAFGDVSPEVALILAHAKDNLTSASVNHLPAGPTLTNAPVNPSIVSNPTIASIANLPAPPNFLSVFLNATRPAGNDTPSVSPANAMANLLPNLPINFNLPPPPTSFPLSQLLANAISLGLPPPPTGNSSLFQASPLSTVTFTPPPPALPTPVPAPSGNGKPPSVRFVSAMGPQTRPHLAHNNDYQHPSSRENSRDHHFRRGNHRRDYYNNNNNNNRNNPGNNNNNNSNNNNANNNNNNNNRNIFS